MTNKVKMLNEIKFSTRQRLQFIEVMAYYTGMISRSMLARAYGISDPAATKDLKLYNDLAPDNLEYNPSLFGFVPSAQFDEVFADLSPQTILAMFSHNLLSVDNPCGAQPIYGISVEALPLPARLPEKIVLAQIIRAMKAGTQLEVEYHSLSHSNDNADKRRIIEPHALINTGLRWHVRAYNHKDYDFRDFVLSRFTHAQQLATSAESSQDYDDEWMEQVELIIEPHPGLNQKQRTALSYDYAMQDGRITLQVRRALAAYLLQQLKVDTSADHSLNPSAHQLVLANRDEVEAIAGWSFIA